MQDSLIKDRLIIGMKDEGLRQRLLQESAGSEITAERVIESARTKELGSNQSREIRGLDYENVDFFQKDRYKDKKLNRGNERKNCTRCNRVHELNKCKAYRTKCSNCKKTGNCAVCCRVKKIEEIRDYTKVENQEIEDINTNFWVIYQTGKKKTHGYDKYKYLSMTEKK